MSEVNLHLGNTHILSIFVLNTALSFKETEAMRKNTESHLASTQRGPGEPESVPPTFAFQTAPSSSCPPLFLQGLDECPPLFLPGVDECPSNFSRAWMSAHPSSSGAWMSLVLFSSSRAWMSPVLFTFVLTSTVTTLHASLWGLPMVVVEVCGSECV